MEDQIPDETCVSVTTNGRNLDEIVSNARTHLEAFYGGRSWKLESIDARPFLTSDTGEILSWEANVHAILAPQ